MAYTTINKGSLYYNGQLYTGTGASLSVTGVGFQPDFVWMKSRSILGSNSVYDSARGVQIELTMEGTLAETTQTQGLTAFNSDGFTIGTLAATNTNAATYNSFNWLAGTTPTATNTAGAGNIPTAGSVKINGSNLSTTLSGTIPATKLSANTTSGFSIVTFNGTGANGTVAHGLGSTPKVIWVKRRDSTGVWACYFEVLGNGQFIRIDDNNPAATDSTYWNDTSPTSSVFTVGTNAAVNASGSSMVAYCFAEVKGFSKFGKYIGNGGSNGPFVYTGFKPSFLIARRSNGTVVWPVFNNKASSFNPVDKYIITDNDNTEATGFNLDFLSNGFKLRTSAGTVNAGSGNIIYMAFAENPFVTSTGIPVTAR